MEKSMIKPFIAKRVAQEFTDGMVFVKELYVPGKLVNLVVKPQ